jgi:signal transduction histidine kinase
LHDSVAQVASAAVRRLEIVDDIRELLPAPAIHDLDRGLELVRQTLREIRGVIQGLRPVTLESLGLAAALKEELPRLIDLPVSVVAADLPAGRPAIEVELALFRCAQEAVHNVRKHARACTRIEVRLFAAKDHLTLEIINDGEVVALPTADGPALSTHGQGLGLLMMRERIAAIGGCAQIAPNEGGGATVRIEVNLPAETGKGT